MVRAIGFEPTLRRLRAASFTIKLHPQKARILLSDSHTTRPPRSISVLQRAAATLQWSGKVSPTLKAVDGWALSPTTLLCVIRWFIGIHGNAGTVLAILHTHQKSLTPSTSTTKRLPWIYTKPCPPPSIHKNPHRAFQLRFHSLSATNSL